MKQHFSSFLCKAVLNYLKVLKMGSARGLNLFIYKDFGCGPDSAEVFRQALNDVVDRNLYHVSFITAKEIKAGKLDSDCQLIAIGGGFDRGFIKALGSDGIKKIRQFVHKGGSYLGMCAGAYFACDFIEFDKNGPLEVVGERHLKFYPGNCIGPMYPNFEYNSKKGVHPAPVKYTNKFTLDTYMQGGGAFFPKKDSSVEKIDLLHVSGHENNKVQESGVMNGVRVLGNYTELPGQPAAIVSCQVGQGRAVLSGVHLEFPSHLLNKDDIYLKPLMGQFESSEDRRDIVFRDLLKELGLKCNEARITDNAGSGDSILFPSPKGKGHMSCVFSQPCSIAWGSS